MFLNINNDFGVIFAVVKEKTKGFQEQPVLQTGEHKKKDVIMKRTNDTIEMLQYQLKRYKAMRKGAACQSLRYKLQKLMSQQANA